MSSIIEVERVMVNQGAIKRCKPNCAESDDSVESIDSVAGILPITASGVMSTRIRSAAVLRRQGLQLPERLAAKLTALEINDEPRQSGQWSVSGGDGKMAAAIRTVRLPSPRQSHRFSFWTRIAACRQWNAGVLKMLKRFVLVVILAAVAAVAVPDRVSAAPPGQPSDWQRFYYYPYVYYPHSFQKPQTYDHLYYRYQPSQRIPVYNKSWYNFYPSEKPYHSGHHFILDVF